MTFANEKAMSPLVARGSENSENETQKRKLAMVQKLEKWTPSTGFQTRVQIISDSMLIINWMRRVWKIVDYKKAMRTKWACWL